MSNDPEVNRVLYGIRNCDSCRRAMQWLDARQVAYTFHDFRVSGLDETVLAAWLASPQGSYLLNKRSTSWRQLTDQQKQLAETSPLRLLIDHPTLIKRPVITDGQNILGVGFVPATMEKLF